MVVIRQEACNHCDLCNRVCPGYVIAPGPAVLDGNAAYCIECGQCVAVCPTGAITLDGFETPPSAQAVGSQALSSEAMLALLRSRRSGRLYRDEPVSREHLEAILNAASQYPSSSNLRPVRAYALTSQDSIEELRSVTLALYRRAARVVDLPGVPFLGPLAGYAPAQIRRMRRELRTLVSPPAERDLLFHGATAILVFATPSRRRESEGDAWLAAQSAVLYAETIPVATCYNGVVTVAAGISSGVRRALGLGRGEKAIAALTLGYPGVRYPRPAPRPLIPTRWL